MAQQHARRNQSGGIKSKSHRVQEMDTSATAQVQSEPPKIQVTTAITAPSSGRQTAKQTNGKSNSEPSSTAATANHSNEPRTTLNKSSHIDYSTSSASSAQQLATRVTTSNPITGNVIGAKTIRYASSDSDSDAASVASKRSKTDTAPRSMKRAVRALNIIQSDSDVSPEITVYAPLDESQALSTIHEAPNELD